MNTDAIHHTKFYHVHVKVTPDGEPGVYKVKCHPERLEVTHENSVILYQLVEAPEDVTFWSLDISPRHQNQFKAPQIGATGRMLTLDDIDREKRAHEFHVTLRLTDPFGSEFRFDPQVINRPG